MHRTQLPIGPAHPWLAPLAGYSNLAFRLLCREFGASVACTEMISAKGLVLGQGKKSNATGELLATWPPLASPVTRRATAPSSSSPRLSPPPVRPDTPLVVQLFGAEASFMGEAVRILVDGGYTWFDCNMGCSVPKVRKSGSGSAMLQDPDNALAVAEAMTAAAGKRRVGFKLRLGKEAGDTAYLPLAKRLEEAGAGWLTLHPRHAGQKFTGTADWPAVRPLVAQSAIPVMVSGDLFSAADGVNALAVTGAAGIMFARGAMQNPRIFKQFLDLLPAGGPGGGRESGEKDASGSGVSNADGLRANASGVDAKGLEYCIRRHAALIRAFTPCRVNRQGIETGLLMMRAFVPRYVKECAGARHLRRAMAECPTWEAMDALLDNFFARAANLERVEDTPGE